MSEEVLYLGHLVQGHPRDCQKLSLSNDQCEFLAFEFWEAVNMNHSQGLVWWLVSVEKQQGVAKNLLQLLAALH